MNLNRRTVLRAGLGGLAASALPNGAYALRSPSATPGPILISLIMRGGHDGLSFAPPIGNPNYVSVRQNLAYPSGVALPLIDSTGTTDPDYGLHPALFGLQEMWSQDELALFHQIGKPTLDRSHFTAQDSWARLGEDTSDPTGWIGRLATLRKGDPLSGGWDETGVVGLGTGNLLEYRGDPSLPPATAPHPPLLIRSLADGNDDDRADLFTVPQNENFPVDSVFRGDKALEMEQAVTSNRPVIQAFNSALVSAHDLAGRVDSIVAGGYKPTFPQTPFGQSLRDIMVLIAEGPSNGICPHVYAALTGGFDTHANQLGDLQGRWTEVSDAVAALKAELVNQNLWNQTLILVYSEFGRTNRPNGVNGSPLRGTDHGHGNTAAAFGGTVIGGHYGDPAVNMSDLYLSPQLDFRDLFYTSLHRHLGLSLMDAQAVVPGGNLIPFLP